MEYYGNNDWRDYHLAHYGKKGMKWGKHVKLSPQEALLQARRNAGAAVNSFNRNVLGTQYRRSIRSASNQMNLNTARSVAAGINLQNGTGDSGQNTRDGRKYADKARRAQEKKEYYTKIYKTKSTLGKAQAAAEKGKAKLTSWMGKKKKKKKGYGKNITVTHTTTLG
jgi:NAD+--asparagine ADP-ribosyltransferase